MAGAGLCVWMERRRPVYIDGDLIMLGGENRPALPPPGKQALRPPGAADRPVDQAAHGASTRVAGKRRPASLSSG
jgi:hypothetical protein